MPPRRQHLAANRELFDDAWQRRAILIITAAMCVAYTAGILWTTGVRGVIAKGDARTYVAFLPSLVLDRDLDLRNQFRVLQPEGAGELPYGPGRNGLARTPFPISPALLWLPGYVVGLGVDRAAGHWLGEPQPLGYGIGSLLGAALWSIILVGIGAEYTRRLVREAVGPADAFTVTVLSWLGTSALYYSAVSPLYSHATAWFAVSVMLWWTWRAAQEPERLGWWLAAGLAAGWVVAVRLQDVPLLIVPATMLVMAPRSGRALRSVLTRALVWTGAAVLGYLPEALTWHHLEGTWLPFGGVSALKPLRVDEMTAILFSTGYRGWISWTPLVLPALAGLLWLSLRAGRPAARWLAWSAMIGVAGVYLLDVMHPFGAGAAFGGRRYVSVTPFVALGLATFLNEPVGWWTRRVAWAFLAILGVWNLCVLLSYEALIIRHGTYGTLLQTVKYTLGYGAP